MNIIDAAQAPADPPPPTRTIECWFDFGSNYSYLSVMRIEALAARAGMTVAWRPFLLGVIFRSFGWDSSPFVLQPRKGDYVWADMVRQCAKLGLPWTRPTRFPRGAVLAHRVALAGAQADWIGEFCRRVMQLNFVHDRDLDNEQAIREVLGELGLDAEPVMQRAQSEAIKLLLREQTDTAAARGIFGAPTFFVGGEMFWGNDRLEDALACACSTRSGAAGG